MCSSNILTLTTGPFGGMIYDFAKDPSIGNAYDTFVARPGNPFRQIDRQLDAVGLDDRYRFSPYTKFGEPDKWFGQLKRRDRREARLWDDINRRPGEIAAEAERQQILDEDRDRIVRGVSASISSGPTGAIDDESELSLGDLTVGSSG